MRIAVMGSGGLGGYFGARLASGGADLHFIAGGRHLQAMRSGPALYVQSAASDEESAVEQALTAPVVADPTAR